MFTVKFSHTIIVNRLNNKICYLQQLHYAGYSNNHALNIQLRFSWKWLFWT